MSAGHPDFGEHNKLNADAYLRGIPTDQEIRATQDTVARAILAAIQRLLEGRPKVVTPRKKHPVTDLEKEAGVKHYQLYEVHPSLKDRFVSLRDNLMHVTPQEAELQSQVERLNEMVKEQRALQERTRQEGDNWKGLAETLGRAVNVLKAELKEEQTRSRRLSDRVRKGKDGERTKEAGAIRSSRLASSATVASLDDRR